MTHPRLILKRAATLARLMRKAKAMQHLRAIYRPGRWARLAGGAGEVAHRWGRIVGKAPKLWSTRDAMLLHAYLATGNADFIPRRLG